MLLKEVAQVAGAGELDTNLGVFPIYGTLVPRYPRNPALAYEDM